LFLFALAAFSACSHRPAAGALEIRGETMGTTYSVVVAASDASATEEGIRSIVDSQLTAVNRSMSNYDPTAEVSRFNRHRSTDPFPASPALRAILTLSQRISLLTDGAFDVTAAPLVAAWGFGPTRRVPAPPSAAELALARDRTGFRKLSIDDAAGTVAKAVPGLECDLSAIAKGWAVDRVVDALIAAGHRNLLVEIGGDLRVAGTRRPGAPWRIAVERPRVERGHVQRKILLTDRALATSGDYRSFYQSEGRKIAHLIDPRSGRPADNRVASASIVHPSAAHADALATALMVLGVERGMPLARREGWPVLFLVRGENGIEEVTNESFDRLAGVAATDDPAPLAGDRTLR